MPLPDEKLAYKQHAVPQNIMDVEFKLIGDLTMRQFIYLLVFGVIAYIIYLTVFGLFKWPLVLFFTLVGLGLAFVPIQERGMDEWIVNFVKAVYSPTQMVWQKEPILPSAFTYDSLDLVKKEMITLAPTSSRRKLEEYLEVQQRTQVEDELDIPEREYIMKVRQSFAPVEVAVDYSTSVGTQTYTPQFDDDVFEEDEQAEQGAGFGFEQTEQQETQEPQEQRDLEQKAPEQETKVSPEPIEKTKEATPQEDKESFIEKIKKEEKEQKMGFADFVKSRLAQKPETTEKSEGSEKLEKPEGQEGSKIQKEQPEKKPAPEKAEIPSQQPSKPAPKPAPKPKPTPRPKLPSKMTDTLMLTPITPDRHVGRRFTHMSSEEGQLILPVRGEKVLQTSEEADIQKDMDDKTEQLNKLLEQIKGSEEYKSIKSEVTQQPQPQPQIQTQQDQSQVGQQPQQTQQKSQPPQNQLQQDLQSQPKEGFPQELEEVKKVAANLKVENESLQNEIAKLRGEIEKEQATKSEEELKQKQEQLKRLEEQKQKKGSDYSGLQKQLHELQKRLRDRKKHEEEQQEQPQFIKTKPKFASIQPLTKDPNIISGIVKNENNEALQNIVLLVKNNKGEPVRGIKTNSLGQFSLSTPLVNGLYTLEVDPNAKEGLSFDIITVEIKGEIIPPIELVGRKV